MKFVYYIDEDNWTLGEGYITEDYSESRFKYKNVFNKETKYIATVNEEFIYDNLETAKHILKGMIQIQRDKNSKEIERLQKENEILFEKLLNV